MQTNKRKLAIVGTGHRGAGTWGRDAPATCADDVELVGLCDTNSARLAVTRDRLGAADAVASTDLDEMLDRAKPHTLVVCTRDDTHADIIVKALESGIDVVTEKPMATTAEACRRILDAERRTGRHVDVAFNYRFAPTSRKIRELLAEGRIGKVSSVDFHWYLDTRHGADYFRRWHAYKKNSGSLFVHKSTHHFDLLNWFIDSDPVRVFAQGSLRRYGRAGEFRGTRCKGCPHADRCEFHLDISKDPWLHALYEAPSAEDGYVRDACVFREDIDIYDTMTAELLYENGVEVSYSLNAFMPIEGYHLAFNGTKGRIEVRMYEKQAFDAPVGEDEILILGTDRSVERIKVSHGPGGHFGGDPLLHKNLFVPEADDPMNQRAGARAGAMSVLTGVAATRSAETGQPVDVLPLLEAG
ncbi:Gfo/Idh/MocA family protein [Qingshengfaniella alkalisoli]|uniref:Gfo/Idh/MocA family oxidoreductase n=1 Tax=Qingshengfaniella alkalisoli TaxID=2599296 RepID=A0A5B8I9F3_9RHOB|nr:Gfo/Idh/MocA family oxidoreductase [Qingshengfaniella alkalisoli]QDY70895.1 Gfo/Idh/MocA family oxidoreductase [Qingshengfaniella alkalisoli]